LSEYLLESIIIVERDADEECEEPSEDVLKYEDDCECLRHPRYKKYKTYSLMRKFNLKVTLQTSFIKFLISILKLSPSERPS
jgi:hypothetical protein